MNAQQIINEIEEAFEDVTLNDGIGLWHAQCWDDYERDGDVINAAIEKDEKNDWHNLDHNDLKTCESSLSFFDEKGMIFHLPAYIIAEIKGQLECGTIFHLTELSKYGKQQLSKLNNKQKKAITSFLTWCLHQTEYEYDKVAIECAIKTYWNV
jgi:hypothetical protein